MKRLFKYYPSDFAKLTVKVIHMDLFFDVYDDHTIVKSSLKAKALKPIRKLELNAKNLELNSLSCNLCKVKFDYNKKDNIIIIRFSKLIKKGKEFIITTENITRPTKNILEGLYYDRTPKGAPPTQITQCQQWGFQRLVPSIDDMAAKCTYTTTITADKRYTHIISNGDIKDQRIDLPNGRSRIIYDNTKTPMATYLFFLGVGTYDSCQREFEYPSGKKFILELLTFPGSEKLRAERALEILYNGILWINLFTGPDKYKQVPLKKKVMELIAKRNELNNGDKKTLAGIREQLKSLVKPLNLGYEYTGDVYREIAMQNSDFGGMENVGNTTISANRIMPFKEMTDPMFEYMARVKMHEFYHNLNGSEVTGINPFQLWLNEAVTVHIDREYHMDLMGKEYGRLQYVQRLIMPDGTFDKDKGATAMPIEPEGFNDPNELITDVTYVKAPEFVRMVQTIIGKEDFVKGLDLYHRRFKHGNADWKDWIKAMEDVSGKKLKRMARVWLKQTGFPIVRINQSYDERKKRLTLNLKQFGFRKKGWHWEFPFKAALCNKEGNDIASAMKVMKKVENKIIFKGVEKPAFLSLNREYSFYGKVSYKQSKEELVLQARKDKGMINRYIAFCRIANHEMKKLVDDPKAAVSQNFVGIYYEMLSDEVLADKVGAEMLRIPESVDDDRYDYHYEDLYQAKRKIILSIARRYKKELIDIYEKRKRKSFEGPYVQKKIARMKNRQIKNLCLGILSRLDTPDIHRMIKAQFDEATCATNEASAFSLYINSSAKDKMKVLEKYERNARKNPVSYEMFLAIVGDNDSDDALSIIRRVEKSPDFRIEMSNDQRALYGSFIGNKRKSLLTEEGLRFTVDTLKELAQINEYSTVGMLDDFSMVKMMEKKRQPSIVKALLEIQGSLDKEKTPSIYNTISRILHNSPKAMREYRKSTKR